MAEIHGMREALETLRRLPDHVAPRGGGPINVNLYKAARIWLDQTASNAARLGPGNHRRGSGQLARSIVGRLKDQIARRIDPEPERDGHYARVFIGYKARAYWGAFVENGTEKQKAQPFLRPVLDQAGDRPITEFAEGMRRDIERITRNLAR